MNTLQQRIRLPLSREERNLAKPDPSHSRLCVEDKHTSEGAKFNGLGTYCWDDGSSLSGLFEDNYCSRVGVKVFPGGQVYAGELREDKEEGRGVLSEHTQRLVGVWRGGRCTEELLETLVPALDLDAVEGEETERVPMNIAKHAFICGAQQCRLPWRRRFFVARGYVFLPPE